MFDGSTVVLKKLESDYDPTDKYQALNKLQEAEENNWLLTGLIYVNPEVPNLFDTYNIPDSPMNRIGVEKLRPTPEALQQLNDSMF